MTLSQDAASASSQLVKLALLDLPQTTVSVIIVKWKHLGGTTAQPQQIPDLKLLWDELERRLRASIGV